MESIRLTEEKSERVKKKRKWGRENDEGREIV